MLKIKIPLFIAGLALLLVACGGRQQPGQLTLVVEGLPPQVLSSSGEDQANTRRLLFVNSQNILDSYDYKGGYDTLNLSSSKAHIELAIWRYTFVPSAKKIGFAGMDYALLQVGDTIRLRYLPDGGYLLESIGSSELTTLYNLDNGSFNRISDLATACSSDLWLSYMLLSLQKDSGTPSSEVATPDSVTLTYQSIVRQYGQVIDSLVQAGSLPPSYERYYRYRMGLLGVQPLLIERTVSAVSPSLNASLTTVLNDSLCRYISYWYAMQEFREPLVRPSGNGELPRFEYTDSTLIKPLKTWAPDQRGIFDRLSDYVDDIPPHTLNLMRYICVDAMTHSTNPSYPESDKQAYLAKYRALTTDYLDFEYASLDQTTGFSFRFFTFLVEFSVCMWICFAVYLFVRKRLSFGWRRVYLLFSLLLSLAVPLVTLPAQLQLVERTAAWAKAFNFIIEGVFCLYLLGCIYLLYELVAWLWKVRRMWNDSWRIPAEDHTLCILMYENSKPTIFGQSIFFCWDDWWHPVDRDSRDRMRDSQRYRIRKGHMFDSLLLAVMRTLCWANPLLRTYNMELQRVNDMAASHHAYSNRCTTDYAATEEMQSLQSNLVYGLAGSEYHPNTGTAGRKFSGWLHGIKYQLAIVAVFLIIVALVVQLYTTIGTLSKTSLFG